ncbi:MAG: glycosyltransferase family 4 protein [Marinilabiliaceae bacterium]|nr:glycosyltransferase family 4 protein [Marinilabiliaceae bacterium]
MKKKILISLDRIKYPNSGLGRVSIDFMNEVIKNEEFEFTFLVPKGFEKKIPSMRTVSLTFFRRFFSGYMQSFDLVHIIHQLPAYSISKAPKLILTVHDLNFLYTKNEKKRIKYRKRIQKIINTAHVLSFISEFTKNDCLKNLTIPANKKLRVIHNGSGELKNPSSHPSWCPDSPFLFSVGVFLDKKNFHTLVPFLKLLPDTYKLVIAGDCSTRYGERIHKLINENQLEGRIVLPGMITEAEKSYLYHQSEAFVFPSIAEGFGLPVIEAMSVGKPVFCSEKTSLKEIGSRFAYFWKSFDPDQMIKVFTEGMKDFKQHPQKKEEQIKYAQSFTWQKNAAEYIQLYNELLTQ